MSTDLFLMLLADARLPTAGHTQSGQLEPAVAWGLRATEVPTFIDLRLSTVTRVEAATAVVALHHVRQGLPLDVVESAWAARTPSAAMRASSRTMGRALARIVGRLWPELDPLPRDTSRSVVLAVAADACGLPPASLARLVGYDDVQTVASAALKVLPLDPADVAGWVRDALPAIDVLAASVVPLTSPPDISRRGRSQIEAWAEVHASTTRRLFSA